MKIKMATRKLLSLSKCYNSQLVETNDKINYKNKANNYLLLKS